MKIGELETHPYADAFPMLSGVEFERFRDDIKATSLLDDKLYLYKGTLLDGRNRLRACIALGIEPTFVHYDGDDPLGFVMSRNFHRRNMNESQRAIVASKLATLPPGRQRKGGKPAGLSTAAAAAALNVGERTVRDAKHVVEHTAPAVVEAIERGDITLATARELAELELAEQPEALQRVLEQSNKRARGAAARAHRDAANDEQPDPQLVLTRMITRGVRALGGSIRKLQQGNLEVALHGQVLGISVQLQERAA